MMAYINVAENEIIELVKTTPVLDLTKTNPKMPIDVATVEIAMDSRCPTVVSRYAPTREPGKLDSSLSGCSGKTGTLTHPANV